MVLQWIQALAETHPVAVSVGVRSLVSIAVRVWIADLAQDDDASRASVDTERTTGTDVVVDREDHVVRRVDARLFRADGLVDCAGRHHKDALPWADVDAALTHDAFGLIDVDELFRLDGRGEPGSVDLLEDIVVAEFWHWGVCISDRHA